MFVQHVKDAVRKAPKEEEAGDQDKGSKEIRAVQSAHEFQRFVFHFFLLIFIFEAFSGDEWTFLVLRTRRLHMKFCKIKDSSADSRFFHKEM